MTYEQDMAVREKYWYKEGMAAQKAEDEKIIQEIVQEKNWNYNKKMLFYNKMPLFFKKNSLSYKKKTQKLPE